MDFTKESPRPLPVTHAGGTGIRDNKIAGRKEFF
jgi:hypothetical protein